MDERVEQARKLLEDGASYTEAARTIGVDRRWVSHRLPGMGWTQSEGGKFAREMDKINNPER